MKILLPFGLLFSVVQLNAQLVGIGTDLPQKNLSVFGGLNIDQQNTHGATLGTNALTFGSNSNVGIASNRAANELLFFSNNLERMRIQNDGKISINWPVGFKDLSDAQLLNINHTGYYLSYAYESGKHAFMIVDNQDVPTEAFDGSYLFMGTNRQNNLSYIQAERNGYGQNVGNTLMLQYRGNATVGLVASPSEKLEVLGNLKLQTNNNQIDTELGDVMVRGGAGIIRNNTGAQLQKQTKTISINTSFAAGETKTFDFTWDDAFSATPEAYVGNITSGAGGWAEVVMSVALVSTTGGRLYVYNPTGTRNPNFSVNILALGLND